jgi:hypothetical protein
MKPIKDAVGWCTPGDLRKLAHLASQVILNRTVPGSRSRLRTRPQRPADYTPQPWRSR